MDLQNQQIMPRRITMPSHIRVNLFLKLQRWTLLSISCAVAGASIAKAQSFCPPGMLPGLGRCLSQQEIIEQQSPAFANRYGAFARSPDKSNSIVGTAISLPSREEAVSVALAKCGPDCEVWAVFANTCVAVAEGKMTLISSMIGTGPSIESAETDAVKKCRKEKLNMCAPTFSACSLPQRIR